MTLAQFTLGLLALVLIVQTAALIAMRKMATTYLKASELISDTLKMQAETQHLLILRVVELERRMKARVDGG